MYIYIVPVYITGQLHLDADHGYPDPGVGEPTARGLVDLPALPRLRLGQRSLEHCWPLRPRESSADTHGRVEGYTDGGLTGRGEGGGGWCDEDIQLVS